MTAEWSLRKYLGDSSNVRVGSAGIVAAPQQMLGCVRERLNFHGIDPSAHCQRRATRELLDGADLVVAMGLDHRDFLRSEFESHALLFNEIAHGKAEGILDVHEHLADWLSEKDKAHAYAIQVVDYIHDSIPKFMLEYPQYLEKEED